MERRLGRGLGSLLGGSAEDQGKKPGAELLLDRIRPNPFQPRRHFDPIALEELAASIRQHGVLQPIVVRSVAGEHELVAGERRLRASKLAGRSSIPAVVLEGISDQRMLELALVENVQRQDLDCIERALGFRRMQKELSMTQEDVADRVGLKRSTVANHLRLLELPDSVQQAVAKGMITMGHARALLALEQPREQERWLGQIVRDDLSVRQVEQLVRVQPGKARPTAKDTEAPGERDAWVTTLERRLRERTGAKVEIRNSPGFSGQIVISYFGREDLERIAESIAPRERLA